MSAISNYLSRVLICFLPVLALTILFSYKLPAQSGFGNTVDRESALLNKTGVISDRGVAHLNKGKMWLLGIENFGMIGRRRYYPPDVPNGFYSRHGHWGELRWVLLYVAIPPGPWGANVITEDLGIVDRSDQYNVIESLGRYYNYNVSSQYTDWEVIDNSATRMMGDAVDEHGRPLIAVSDNPRSWPEGFLDDSDTWIPTPGQRHWPGPWAVDNNPDSHTYGQEVYGQFVSDRDMFFIMTDKYNGIRAGYEAGVGYPVGLDIHVTGYSYEHPVYENIVFMKYDVIYRDDIASSDPDRQFYAGPIDSVYVGFLFDPDLPGHDPQGKQAAPWGYDDLAVIDKDEDMIMMFDKKGYAVDLGSPYSQGPVSVYSVVFLGTPDEKGVTDYHFLLEDIRYISDWWDTESQFEQILYGIAGSKPDLISNMIPRWLYINVGANPEDPDYPHFDNIDSLIHYNEFDITGNPFPTFYGINGLRPEYWFSTSSGPFVLTPGETYPLHVAIIGSEDNPGQVDPNNFKIPVNTLDFHDRFVHVYENLNTARTLYDNKFNGHFVFLNSLNSGETVSGSVEIQWDVTSVTSDSVRLVDLFYSSDAGVSWDTIAVDMQNSGSFLWDTAPLPDGIHYRVKVIARDSLLIGEGISARDFTINNPGNAPPEITLLYPYSETTVTRTLNLRWHAGDADGDQVVVTIEYSPDDSVSWLKVASGMDNTGEFIWDAWDYPNSPDGILRLIASDGVFTDTVYTPYTVVVDNRREILAGKLLSHTAGYANDAAYVNIVDNEALTGHDYEVTFDDTSDLLTTYTVRDINTDSFVVSSEPVYDVIEGEAFDGVRLFFDLWESLEQINSGWSAKSDTNWWSIEPLDDLAYPRPGYYELRYFGGTADSSWDGRKKTRKLMPFQIWNMSYSPEPYQVIMQFSGNPRKQWESGQTMTFHEPDPVNPETIVKTWLTAISWPDSGDIVSIDSTVSPWDTLYAMPTPPEPGDVYYWETSIPFTYLDTLRFSLDLTPVEAEHDVVPTDYELVQNYPNPFNSSTAIEFTIPKASDVSIIIYDVLGREVKALTNAEYPAGRHLVTWNGRNAYGVQVASGVYFYRLQAESFVKSKKMIVVR